VVSRRVATAVEDTAAGARNCKPERKHLAAGQGRDAALASLIEIRFVLSQFCRGGGSRVAAIRMPRVP
jgi:hypothetical protein